MPPILKVRQVQRNDPRFDNLDPFIPKPPFITVINGAVKAGKSNIIMNLVYNPDFYRGKFDNIVMISPNIHNDKTLTFMDADDDITKLDNPELLDQYLKVIFEEQATNDEWTLVIIDDCLGYIRRGSYLTYLATRYRHRRLALVITSQDFKSIPNIIRDNTDAYMLFRTASDIEYAKYEATFGGSFPGFADMYSRCTDQDYNFMYIRPRDREVYHNFEIQIFPEPN